MATIASAAAATHPRVAGAPTDHDLVAAVRRGDDRAFEVLYERYHRRIAGYIYGMVCDYGRAEDIAQDVFMSALRRMRETDREIAFKPWVYEIAKNACIDQFRRSRRAEEVSYDAEEGLGAADYGKLTSQGPTPDAAVDQKMTLDHLRGAFGGLSDTHHEILIMREFEGLSYREIGEKLGMSRPSVESTLFRARRRLSEEYDELVTGDRCRRVQSIILTAADGALGARDQRSMARHISYCQPCRRQARLSGLDVAVLARKPVRARIAAFLPLPAFLRDRWLPGHPGADAGGLAGSASQQATTLAQWSAAVGTHLDPSVTGWARAAAAAATLAVAGVGASAASQHHEVSLRGALPGSAVAHKSSSAAVPAPTRAAAGSGVTATPTTATQPSRKSAGSNSTQTQPQPAAGGGQATTPATGTPADQASGVEQALKPLVGSGTGSGTGAGASNPGSGTTAPSSPSLTLPDTSGVLPADAGTSAPAVTVPDPGKATTDPAGAAGDAVDQVKKTVTGALGG